MNSRTPEPIMADSTSSAGHARTTGSASALHPIFASLAQSFIDAPRLAKQAQLDAYVKLLQAHDWAYDFSDDPSVYRRGRESLANLRMVQRELDPDFAVWDQHCHPECLGGRSYR